MKMLAGIVGTPVTPFSSDNSISEEKLRKLIDFMIETAKNDALSLPQHMGESLNMTEAERRRVAEIGVDQANGRVPVLIHVSSTSTDMAVSLARHAQDIGAEGVVSTVPYHWQPGEPGIYAHYEKICSSVDISVLAYNFPAKLGVNLSPELLFKLVSQFENFVGMKEASYNTRYFAEVIRNVSKANRSFSLFSGVEMMVPSFALGGAGTFSALSGVIPEIEKTLRMICTAGNFKEALSMQYKVSQMLTVIGKFSLAPGVKAAMEIMERPVGHARLPFLPLSDSEKNQIKSALLESGLMETEPKGWAI